MLKKYINLATNTIAKRSNVRLELSNSCARHSGAGGGGAPGAGGRGQTLCLCLAGATLGNVGIAMSPSVAAIVVCRFLCGAFAASVPVAQAAATELVAPAQAPAALARVAASSQMAVVVGPSCAALLMSAFAAAGVPQAFRLRAVFLTASVFAAGVLGVLARSFQATAAKAQAIASQDEPAL